MSSSNFQAAQETTEEIRSCACPRQNHITGKAPWKPFLFPFTSPLPVLQVSLPPPALPLRQLTMSQYSRAKGSSLCPPLLHPALKLVFSWPSGKRDVPSKPSSPPRPSCMTLGKLHNAFAFPSAEWVIIPGTYFLWLYGRL